MKPYNNEPYLRSEHLLHNGKHGSPVLEIEEIISGCPMQKFVKKNGKESTVEVQKLALKFAGKEKILGLNATNEGICASLLGDGNPEKWIGKKVRLEVRSIHSAGGGKGENEPAIRIMPTAAEMCKLRRGLARMLGKPMTYENGKAESKPGELFDHEVEEHYEQ